MSYQVTLTDQPGVLAARKRVRTPAGELTRALGDGFASLFRHTAEQGATPVGPPQVAYSGEFAPDADVDLDLLLPTDRPVEPGNGVEPARLPAGPVARTYHHGPYDRIGAAYEALFAWIADHDRRQAGPPREVYLTGPDAVSDPEMYLTEVVVPLVPTGN
ncbi:hypothetical protein GCM10010492_74120 [Saccharothrix mutabilis subsp. mutabilis]|uniref:AraC effector-binding domain-containing protein n=1 Tax=Saccharothrix mutabilis subsp. mutabilis TaxID=66855 RepID=A0ABN0UVG2_9PSEU